MGSFIIEGGQRLKGEITPQGAKNEVLQILCARRSSCYDLSKTPMV